MTTALLILLGSLPALLLFASLIFGRYPGESALERARGYLGLPFLKSKSCPLALRLGRTPYTVGGGTLIATSLAGRAPPRRTVAFD